MELARIIQPSTSEGAARTRNKAGCTSQALLAAGARRPGHRRLAAKFCRLSGRSISPDFERGFSIHRPGARRALGAGRQVGVIQCRASPFLAVLGSACRPDNAAAKSRLSTRGRDGCGESGAYRWRLSTWPPLARALRTGQPASRSSSPPLRGVTRRCRRHRAPQFVPPSLFSRLIHRQGSWRRVSVPSRTGCATAAPALTAALLTACGGRKRPRRL